MVSGIIRGCEHIHSLNSFPAPGSSVWRNSSSECWWIVQIEATIGIRSVNLWDTTARDVSDLCCRGICAVQRSEDVGLALDLDKEETEY